MDTTTTSVGRDTDFYGDVTIGIPVFNEERFIRRAAESVVGQCKRLIISDNASSDNTQQVCLDLSREFPNIEYIRHPENLGSLGNWHFMLSKVESPYFMVLGSHDYVAPNFVRILKKVLNSDKDIVLAAAAVLYQEKGLTTDILKKDELFSAWKNGSADNVVQRVRSTIFDDVNLSWAFYGLYKTDVYKRLFTRELPVVGWDNVFLCKVAAVGKIVISNDTGYYLQSRGADTGEDYLMRITANRKVSASHDKLRSEMRLQIFNILVQVEQPNSIFKKTLLRFLVMSRYGVFKLKTFDLVFLLLFLPSKIASEIRRAARRIKRSKLS